MHMNRRDILLFRRYLQILVKLGLVLDSVISQGCVHVENISFTFPGVTFSVGVNLFIAVEDLPYCFLFWHLELVLCVAQSIDNANELALFSQFANEILLIFPPRDSERVSLEFKMQIPPMWDIKLLLSLSINESSRFSSLFIEPACYISSCCFYQRINLGFISIFLYEFCEIIDIIEERYPNVIGGVMCLQFGEDIIPSFMIWLGDEFFKLICCTLF